MNRESINHRKKEENMNIKNCKEKRGTSGPLGIFLFGILLLLTTATLVSAQEGFAVIPDTSIQTTDAETEIPEEINISQFMIGKTEVTQAQFEKVMDYNPSYHHGDNKPVEKVTWWDAIQYCNKRSIQEGLDPCYDLSTGKCDFSNNGYRLPTNTEWSIASCYGETEMDYNTLTKRGNFGSNNVEDIQLLAEDIQSGTSPVAQYEPNGFGLYDVFGNVWEWCYDYYDNQQHSTPAVMNNPTGPSRGVERTIRGGSFVSPGASLNNFFPAMGSSMKPDYSSRFTGFRVVRSKGNRTVQMEPDNEKEWFDQFYQPPEAYRKNLGPVHSLLRKEDGGSINSVSEWNKKEKKVERKWNNLLGEPSIADTPAVNVKVIKTYDEDIYWGKLMYLQVEPEFWEKVYLMIPKKPIRKPTPAVITPYYDVDVPAGKNMGGRAYSPKGVRHFAYLAVQNGYIALAVRWFGESYGEGYSEAVANLHIRHPGCTGMGKWVWDAHRIVDYLYTLPNVDKDHIGIIGHSMASKMAFYGAVMDERISVAVMSEGGISLQFANYEDYWYFGDFIREIQDETDQHELLGIMAPRPLLLIGGGRTDGEKSWYYINAGREVYNLYHKEENLGYYHHGTGHSPTPKAVSLAFEWLNHFLNPSE